MAPPGRFSMISGWPHFWRSSSPSARMKMSLRPPALVVVIAFTGRFGQSSAAAGDAAKCVSSAASGSAGNFISFSHSSEFDRRFLLLWLKVALLGGGFGNDTRLLQIGGKLL